LEWELVVPVRLRCCPSSHYTTSIAELLESNGTTTGRLADYDTLLAAQEAELEIDPCTFAGAAAAGDVQKMIRLLAEWPCAPKTADYTALSCAAKGGSVEAMRWLMQHGFDCKRFVVPVVLNAAYYGHLDVLRFLHEDGHTVAELTGSNLTDPCELAASRGHLEVLRWLHEHDWPLGDASECAASAGHTHILMYLKEEGIRFNEQTMLNAVKGGHLAVCQYLLTTECPYDAETLSAAVAESNSIEIIQFVWQLSGTPAAAVLSDMLERVTERNNTDLAAWLQQQGAVMLQVNKAPSLRALLCTSVAHRCSTCHAQSAECIHFWLAVC
jgi:hypothetical protein